MNCQIKTLFLSHGGGPLPLLGDPNHKNMVENLKLIASKIGKPDAIIVVSAHWETQNPTVTSGNTHSLYYDYYGFPAESYQIQYPCPALPSLAYDIQDCLNLAGIESAADEQRGLDHGVFVPLKIMYPDANIPCVQLSLVNSLEPDFHIAMGQALKNLTQQNLLVIGSGFSFHNMSAFSNPKLPNSDEHNLAFEEWLKETITVTELSDSERNQRLLEWQKAPGARFCHPREEHLLPLHVCYGLARKSAEQHFSMDILNKKASMFLWE